MKSIEELKTEAGDYNGLVNEEDWDEDCCCTFEERELSICDKRTKNCEIGAVFFVD